MSAIPITEKLLLNAGGWQAYPDVAVAPAKALMVDLPQPASTVTEYLAALPADRRREMDVPTPIQIEKPRFSPSNPSNHCIDQLVTLCKVWT